MSRSRTERDNSVRVVGFADGSPTDKVLSTSSDNSNNSPKKIRQNK